MALVINTNMASENAVRLLDQTSRSQKVSMERLTSGLRINKTADDAAGKAVVVRMDSQVRGTDMATRNAQDGINLIQTADGAVEEMVNMLQRMRELAVQSANDTYTDAQRSQMNEEFKQLRTELDRVAKTTKFNGTSLLNGSVGTTSGSQVVMSFWVGWETAADNQVKFSAQRMTASVLGGGNGSRVADVTISVQGSALQAMSVIDKALSTINTQRAKWGALQNRLEYTISNLQNVNENIKASRSQIQDADFARESANLARTQVLQQAGMAMLSQANQNSQQVLSLLR